MTVTATYDDKDDSVTIQVNVSGLIVLDYFELQRIYEDMREEHYKMLRKEEEE